MTLQLRIATHSEIGLVRKNNQDSGYASPHLLAVADGMGGAAAGDLASAVAIDAIRKIDTSTADEHMLEVLAGALHKANDRIADLVDADYSLEGMGTTVTGAVFDGSQFGLAHIGDSRAYLLRDSHLERLTHDHSWVQSLVDDGKITEEEAAVHPHRSLLLRVLNGQPANDPDLTMVPVVAGDRLLICSDGLCGLVEDPVIEDAMRLPDLDAALRRLVEEALAAGGIDNITVVLADVVESGATEAVFVLGAASERDIPAVETRMRIT
ncbi:MAG: serine/threonine-protein phosphatase, partial [Propionibacteriaceae bacterium]|nr:serine/threonine-protein phosphatase [Propionibacteriaceae bacterium]